VGKKLIDPVTGVIFRSHGENCLAILFEPDTPKPWPTILLCHGFPGIDKHYDLAEGFRENGFLSLIIHYRGTWGSDGAFSFFGALDDASAALDYLESREDVLKSKLAIFGHSMGSWVAIITAARDPRIKAIVSASGIGDMSKYKRADTPTLEPYYQFVKGLTPEIIKEERKMRERKYNPIDYVDTLSPKPLLIVHGDSDAWVDVRHSKLLYNKAKEPKELYIIENTDHRFTRKRRKVIKKIVKWMKKNL